MSKTPGKKLSGANRRTLYLKPQNTNPMKALSTVLFLLFLSYTITADPIGLEGTAVNFSIRAELNEKPLIHGLAIEGTQLVLFRAVGTSLDQFDVHTEINDPYLTLYDADGKALARSVPVALLTLTERELLDKATTASGAFPLADDSKEAIIIYPVSGPATLHAKSISGNKGELLIESYVIPTDAIEASSEIVGNERDQFNTIQIMGTDFSEKKGAGVEILDYDLTDDCLSLIVKYSGGCPLDEFDLLYDPSFLESNPPQANIYLRNNSHQNVCGGVVHQFTEKIIFNIKPLVDSFNESYPNSPIDFSIRLYTHIGDTDTLYSILTYKDLLEIEWLENGFPDGVEDPFEINEVSFDPQVLSITTSYSGGCADHDFRLLAEAPSISQSTTSTLKLFLIHDGKDDECDAYPSEILQFDYANFLKDPVIQEGNNYNVEIYTRINGVNKLYDSYSPTP